MGPSEPDPPSGGVGTADMDWPTPRDPAGDKGSEELAPPDQRLACFEGACSSSASRPGTGAALVRRATSADNAETVGAPNSWRRDNFTPNVSRIRATNCTPSIEWPP